MATKDYIFDVQVVKRSNAAVRLVDGGSSGGPLLNSKLALVGVSYAGNITDEDFHIGYAIPLSKVREFLNKYIYSS